MYKIFNREIFLFTNKIKRQFLTDELEVMKMIGVDIGGGVDLQRVVVLVRVLKQTVHRVQHLKVGLPQVLHRLQNKEKPIRTTFTLRFGSLKMIFECSIARCDVGLGRAIVQCQKNPLRKPKLSINRAILSAHFSAVKFCIGFFCWIGFFWFCIGFFCNWMLQLLLKIVAKNLNYASLHVCT